MCTKTFQAYRKLLVALVMSLAMPLATGSSSDVQIEELPSSQGRPYAVTLSQEGDALRIEGMIRKALTNPSRRLYGNAYVVFLNPGGVVLSTRTAKVYRVSLAKHTHRGRFRLTIREGELPGTAQKMLVSYGRIHVPDPGVR